MNRWIVGKELEEKYLPIIKNFIEELESINSETSTDYMEKDFSDTELNPFTLCSLLEELGYNKGDQDTNGWELDFWIPFTKEGFKSIEVSGCGMTFELLLSETEVDYE